MKSLFVLLSAIFVQGAWADVQYERVHSIVMGDSGEPHLVKLSSGEVIFVEPGDEYKLRTLEKKLMAPTTRENFKFFENSDDFTPTAVEDQGITEIFKRMNPYMRRKSECSDRAHVWAWDEFQRSGIRSQKAFLFLTDTYIKRHRYKWWFHVAPMYTTKSGQKIVMDFQFFDRPVTYSQWKNALVFTKRECVKDFRFLDYDAGADQTEDCYQKLEPMYYRLPTDISAFENGRDRTEWNVSEVNSARNRAFFRGVQE